MGPVVFDQPVMQHLVGDGLQLRIEGGAHRQPALVERILAEAGDQLAAHLLGEIIGAHGLGRPARSELQRLGRRGCGFRGGDVAILLHPADHPVAPRQRRFGMLVDGVVVGRLGQRGEIGAFADGQIVQRLVEIIERRGGHAVIAGAEIDLVQIELEDAVLAEGLLDAQRQHDLAHLALERDLVAEQEVLGDLLGDGGGADRPPVAAQMGQVGEPARTMPRMSIRDGCRRSCPRRRGRR